MSEREYMDKIKWVREFDGGQYVSEDGRAKIILVDGSGKFSYMRRYQVTVDGEVKGSCRLLKDAKELAVREMTV